MTEDNSQINLEKTKLANKRTALHCYEQQLQTARRVARHTVRKRLEQGLELNDPDPGFARTKFKSLIAQELFDSLIFFPDANPVVEEIRQELCGELRQKVEFTYPPGGTLSLAVRENGNLRKLTEDEQRAAHAVLHRLTGEKVDKTLSLNHMGIHLKG